MYPNFYDNILRANHYYDYNYSNNNYSNNKMKNHNYQEKNSSVTGGGLDTSFHGLSLKNPNVMSSHQSSSVFGLGQKNRSSSTKSSSREKVRNFIVIILTVFLISTSLFLFVCLFV